MPRPRIPVELPEFEAGLAGGEVLPEAVLFAEQDRAGLAAGEVLQEAVLFALPPCFLVEIVPCLQQFASLDGTQDA
jgi:hypothetical protein